MAIDSTLFGASIPAATYAVGDRIPLAVIRGPAVVRDGYGSCKLKRIAALADHGTYSGIFSIHIKNSNWVDEMSNPAIASNDTMLANTSGAIQSGQDAPLTPNSGWQVYAECIQASTVANAFDVFALIDVDYPSVAAIQNPREVTGFPVTIDNLSISHTITAAGSVNSAIWTTVNVDILKAGSKYLLTEAAFRDGSAMGFISISGAAGQAGLERIIPVRSASNAGMKFQMDYSTPLVKGPMNINICSFGTSATVTPYVYLDFVKKGM